MIRNAFLKPDAASWHHLATDDAAGTASQALAGLTLRGLADGGITLRKKTVLLLGLGAVGGLMLKQLARLGVKRIIACDPDTYDADSIATQPCNWSDAGRPKAQVQFEQARCANPSVELEFYQCDFQELSLATVLAADVLVAAPDNAEAVVHAGQLAVGLGKFLVQAAVDPDSWSAVVRGYDLRNPDQDCPACALGAAEWQRLTSRIGCDPQTARRQGGEATRSLTMVAEAAAALGVAEVIKRLTDQHALALTGEEFLMSLQSYRGYRTRLDRNPACRCPHEQWQIRHETRSPRQVSLAMLGQHLGLTEPDSLLQVRGERPWISCAGCDQCGRRAAVQSFAQLGTALATCDCGGQITAGTSGWRSILPAVDLHACWQQSLDKLGIKPGQAVGMALDGAWTYVFFDHEATSEE